MVSPTLWLVFICCCLCCQNNRYSANLLSLRLLYCSLIGLLTFFFFTIAWVLCYVIQLHKCKYDFIEIQPRPEDIKERLEKYTLRTWQFNQPWAFWICFFLINYVMYVLGKLLSWLSLKSAVEMISNNKYLFNS